MNNIYKMFQTRIKPSIEYQQNISLEEYDLEDEKYKRLIKFCIN